MWKTCLLLTALVLAGCAHPLQKNPSPPLTAPKTYSKEYRKVPAFTQVEVRGRVNVHLHTGYKQPQLLLSGDPRDIAQVRVQMDHNKLFLSLGKGYPRYGEVSAEFKGQVLNLFRYEGTGIIKGNQLHTRYLELYLANQGTTQLGGTIGLQRLEVVGSGTTIISGITSYDLEVLLRGNPKVQLSGFISLSRLNIEGDAWLSLYWIRGNHLKIKASQGSRIQLAGKVNRLEVELWDRAQFKGRYLRAQRSFVKTHGKSVAEIFSLAHQSSLASDSSDIYYYYIPDTRADFMAFDGSVLKMREWSPYDFRDFTRYNKQFP